jgi:hypothetical protein
VGLQPFPDDAQSLKDHASGIDRRRTVACETVGEDQMIQHKDRGAGIAIGVPKVMHRHCVRNREKQTP